MNIQCINSKLARKLVWPMLIISIQTNNVVTLKSFQSINFECTRMSQAHQDLTSSKFLHWAAWQVAGGTFSSSGHRLLKKFIQAGLRTVSGVGQLHKREDCVALKKYIWQPGAVQCCPRQKNPQLAMTGGVQQWMQSKLSGIGVIYPSIASHPAVSLKLDRFVGRHVITRIHLWPMLS